MEPLILPKVKNIELKNGHFDFSGSIRIDKGIEQELRRSVNLTLGKTHHITEADCRVSLQFTHDDNGHPQGYKLIVDENGAKIKYGSMSGAFYALITLKHLCLQYKDNVPHLEITDYPDIEVRGMLQDISRDKIPTMKSLFRLIDILADLKINQLQFYIEGFSFGYPSFKEFWENETPITSEEFAALDQYCSERYIDLVPNQNCLGHMSAWLATERFAGLAECPEGFSAFGMVSPPSTLDPCNEGSIELVEKMADDLLPNFSSGLFCPNLDEPFELGCGKNREVAEKIGIGRLYTDFVKKIDVISKKHGKRMIIAGDIVTLQPELISLLPDDIIIFYWGYEDITPFDMHAATLAKSGHDFYLMCGTSTSMSVSGKTDNMIRNIRSAVDAAVKYRAKGVIVTDWGDGGHWQPPAAAYPGIAFCSALCWNSNSCTREDVSTYLDMFVFKDDTHKISDIIMDLGNYYQFEDLRIANMTTTIVGLKFGIVPKQLYYKLMDGLSEGINMYGRKILGTEIADAYLPQNRKEYDYDGITALLGDVDDRIERIRLMCDDGDIVRDELKNAVNIIKFGADIRHYIDTCDTLDRYSRKEQCLRLVNEVSGIINKFRNYGFCGIEKAG